MQRILQENPTIHQSVEAALESPEPIIRRPSDPVGPLGAVMNFTPEYSSIAAPLMAGDQPLGVLTLAHSTYGRFGSEHVP